MAELVPDPTADYPPYSGDDSACPKCVGGTLSSDYQSPGTRWMHQGACQMRQGATEWMLRSCFNCGFERPEQCADAVDPELPEGGLADWERELLEQERREKPDA